MEQSPKQTRLLWAGVAWLALVFLFGLHLRFEAAAAKSPAPGPSFEQRIVDRMVLLAQFDDDLSPDHRRQLLEAARSLEEDPLRQAALETRDLPPHLADQLSPSLRAYLDGDLEPTSALRTELATARSRLTATAVGLGVLALFAGVTALFASRSTSAPVLLTGGEPLAGWGVFLLWSFVYLFGGALLVWPLQSSLSPIWTSLTAQLFGYLALCLLLARWLKGRARTLWGSLGLGWVGRGYLLALGSVLVVNLVARSVLGLPPRSSNPILDLFAQATPAETTALVLLAVLVGPFFEELVFRGWLQTGLVQRYGTAVGIVVTAAIFALFHADILGTPALFTLGLVFGWVYHRSGSLATAFAVHALWNSTTFCLLWSGLP